MTNEDAAARLRGLLREHRRGVLATLKRDGRPQLSTVDYAYDARHDAVRISVTDSRAKTRNLRRDPRASLHVATEGMGAYVVVEGTATLTPTAAAADDATVRELVEVYRAVAGEHPDWAEFRAAMVAERRLVVRLPVGYCYGRAPAD